MSCTDVKCVWTAHKAAARFDFDPSPLSTFCCVEAVPTPILKPTADEVAELFDELCNLNENSALALHVAGRNTKLIADNPQATAVEDVQPIILNMLHNEVLKKIGKLPTSGMEPCCKNLMESLDVRNLLELCVQTLQSQEAWHKSRQFRITGSRVYTLYTYAKNKKPDWKLKAKQFFWPSEFFNKFVKHGILYEHVAIEKYTQLYKVKIVKCGLVVHPDYPWMGYSPDAVICGSNGPEILIEIKCLWAGKRKSITDCLSLCPYLNTDGTLKKKHRYYGQIQLGMLIMNLRTCHFIIFPSFDSTMYTLSVPFDEKFAIEMTETTQKVYAEKIIHRVCTSE